MASLDLPVPLIGFAPLCILLFNSKEKKNVKRNNCIIYTDIFYMKSVGNMYGKPKHGQRNCSHKIIQFPSLPHLHN